MSMYEQHRFGMQLAHLSRAWRAELDRRLAELGLSQARWLVLLHLARNSERPTQGELACSVGVENPTLARLLDALEAQQLIERQPDQNDRRVNKIALTESALAVIEDIESIAAALRAEVFAGLSEQDIEHCQQIQSHMLANLEKIHEARFSQFKRTLWPALSYLAVRRVDAGQHGDGVVIHQYQCGVTGHYG